MEKIFSFKAKIFKRINPEVVKILKNGGIGVLLTDTIYGICGKALSKEVVKRIWKLKRRSSKKRAIVLISKIDDLRLFGIKVNKKLRKILEKIWPAKISVSLPCHSKKFSYLHAGKRRFAFRIPAKKSLIKLISKTGPLVAPSANWEGFEPAKNINEAKKYFGNLVDFYVDEGKIKKILPSTLIEIRGKKIICKRKGKDFEKLKKIKGFKIFLK